MDLEKKSSWLSFQPFVSKEEAEVDIKFMKIYELKDQPVTYFRGKVNTSKSYIWGTWGHSEDEAKGEFWIKNISTRHAELEI